MDRLLVRAAEQVWAGLCYYEDYPYAQQPSKLETTLTTAADWRATVIPLDAADLDARCDAISEFRSQLSTFFAGRTDLDAQVKACAGKVGGERVWGRCQQPWFGHTRFRRLEAAWFYRFLWLA